MMKKKLALLFAAMFIFTSQVGLVEAAKVGKPATPIEKSRVYPKDVASNLRYSGTVMIKAIVDEKGKVKRAEIMRSSGSTKIDKAALTAASKWEFKPAVDEKGKPIENWYMIRFDAKDF